MKKIVIEVPFYSNLSGGIMRQTRLAKEINKLIIELPRYSTTSGGIKQTIELTSELNKKYDVHLRFQKNNPLIDYSKIDFEVPFSVGLPDLTFPESDVVITYSDNPYGLSLSNLPQIKKVLIYMLSYGMCFERERKNVFNNKITVMSSTTRTKRLIEKEGRECTCVGFGLDSMNEFFVDCSIKRKKYAALLYHYAPDKKYEMGVEICDSLYAQGLIEGTVVFGTSQEYEKFKHPKSLIKNFQNASHKEIRGIFNLCSVFVMPSTTEGLNLTPIESTLCGCPAVICDGAIDDIFFDKKTCFIAEKGNYKDIISKSEEILSNSNYSLVFKDNIERIVKQFTWENTINNIEKLF